MVTASLVVLMSVEVIARNGDVLIVVVVRVAVNVVDEDAVIAVDTVASTSNITLQKKSTVFLVTTYFLFKSTNRF